MTKLSFVIPCYRSELTINNIVREIIETVNARSGYSYEIIAVNDNSPDRVYDVLKQLAQSNPAIKVVNLSMNFGQHAALMAGFHVVSGDFVICLDDDGQTPASEVFKLVEQIEAGYDLVYAQYAQKKHGFFRNLGSALNDRMAQYLIGKPKQLTLSSYFCTRRFIIDELINYRNAYPYVAGLLLRITKKTTNVMTTHRDRELGTSGYTLKKLLSLWLNGFTAFSIKPLRVATLFGMLLSTLGFMYGGYLIFNKFTNPATPLGYSSIMTAIIFIGGMILLTLGLIGEYVGRIYISINNAPQFVIKETLNVSKMSPKSSGEPQR